MKNDFMTRTLWAVLLLALFMVTSKVEAQSPDDYLAELMARDYTSGDLIEAAQELKRYAEDGGVGIILSYFPWKDGHAVEDIAAAYIQEFGRHNTEADFRVVINDRIAGAAIYFIVKETAQGPFSPNDAFSMVPDIAAQNRFAHGL